jgi:predicted nucleic-acid-binding Zn-ribbon protein
MSTKHIRTAADLVRYKAFLTITCRDCGNVRTVGGFDILKETEINNLDTLQGKLKCSLCGAKNPKLDTIMPPQRN